MKKLLWLGQRSIGALTLLVVAMFFARWFWPLELPTNFRPQLLLGAVLLTAFVGVVGTRHDALLGLIPIALLSLSVASFYFGGPPALQDDVEEIRVLQYNILFHNDEYDAIIDEVVSSTADIVVLHEVTSVQWSAIGDAVLETYPHMLFSPASVGGIHTDEVMLSKTPLELSTIETDFRNPPFAARTELAGQEVLAVALHTHPSRTNSEFIDDRKAETEAAIDAIKQHDLPAIIITDLNVAPTSPEYGALLDELDWENPRQGLGLTPTWSPAFGILSPLFGVAIDHVFVSPELTVHSYELGEGQGSDHKTLLATLSLK